MDLGRRYKKIFLKNQRLLTGILTSGRRKLIRTITIVTTLVHYAEANLLNAHFKMFPSVCPQSDKRMQ